MLLLLHDDTNKLLSEASLLSLIAKPHIQQHRAKLVRDQRKPLITKGDWLEPSFPLGPGGWLVAAAPGRA